MMYSAKKQLITFALGVLASFGASNALAQDENSDVSIAPSPEWQVLAIHDLICVNAECDGDIGAIVATVALEGDSQAIELSPDKTKVTSSSGEELILSGVMLMEIPDSARTSTKGLMTDLTVNLGETEYVGRLFGFQYGGKFSESLVSGGMTIGPNGPTTSPGSQAIIELVPVESDAWLDNGNLPLQRVILSREINTERNVALVFIMSPGAGDRMLLAGPKGETVTVALLFGGNHEDFELLQLSARESLELNPGAFTRFLNSISEWWAE